MAFYPGLGGGFGKSLNMDVDAGAGAGAFAGAGVPPPGIGGAPFLGGFGGVPYVPVTPLGALGGVKGDLLVPIVAVGVAFFLLILIILAVKAALTWKMHLLSGMASKKFRRDTMSSGGKPEGEELDTMTNMVLKAIQSQDCAQNMICQIGTLAKSQSGLPSLIRIVESIAPSSMQQTLQILRSAAEGSLNCNQDFKCGSDGSTTTTTTPPPSPPPPNDNGPKANTL